MCQTGLRSSPIPARPFRCHPLDHSRLGLPIRPLRTHRVQRIQAAALVILATGVVLSLIYVAKLILVVILVSVLMAFVLAPVVDALSNLRVPRAVGASLAVFLLVAAVATVSYLSYARAVDFMSQMPEYKIRLKHILDDIRQQAEQFERSTETYCRPSRKTRTQSP